MNPPQDQDSVAEHLAEQASREGAEAMMSGALVNVPLSRLYLVGEKARERRGMIVRRQKDERKDGMMSSEVRFWAAQTSAWTTLFSMLWKF